MTPPIETTAQALPDHTQLPCEDGSVHNPHEHPQSDLLTACLLPRLRERHPDGRFFVGADVGLYWKITDPPLKGCKAPDWFYVPNVPPLLKGLTRRSYVLWQEHVPPLVVMEYVSGDGAEERDATPQEGKFWVYEQAICATYYVIHDPWKDGGPAIELYQLIDGRYRPVPANAAGRYPIEPLGIELGLWPAVFREIDLPWLRAWDRATGVMIPHPEELAHTERARAEKEQKRAEKEQKRADAAEALVDDFRREVDEVSERAEKERKRAERLAERLRALGVDPDAA